MAQAVFLWLRLDGDNTSSKMPLLGLSLGSGLMSHSTSDCVNGTQGLARAGLVLDKITEPDNTRSSAEIFQYALKATHVVTPLCVMLARRKGTGRR